jgi:hypothetical protein
MEAPAPYVSAHDHSVARSERRRFRALDPACDGRLDLNETRALVFVLDHASVKPVTKGKIWFADVGAYR